MEAADDEAEGFKPVCWSFAAAKASGSRSEFIAMVTAMCIIHGVKWMTCRLQESQAYSAVSNSVGLCYRY